MDIEDILGSNRIEDVSWLCCLSESELDLLMQLKTTVLRRADVSKHKSLARNFDLKILRALGLIVMQLVKQGIDNMSDNPVLEDICTSLDRCNLLKQEVDDGSSSLSMEELRALIGSGRRKRAAEIYNEVVCKDPKRRKSNNGQAEPVCIVNR